MRSDDDGLGLKRRANRDGTVRCYWYAPESAIKAGYEPRMVRLHGPAGGAVNWRDPAHRDFVEAECRRLQGEAREWLAGQTPRQRFDGTVKALIDRYESDADSPFQDLRGSTKRVYLSDLRKLRAAVGGRQLAEIKRADLKRWYEAAKRPKHPGEPERLRSARGLMITLKIVLNFGASEEIDHCRRIRDVLADMRFKQPKPRRQRPTFAQAKAVYDKAREMGVASIALGTALQYEGMLRQYDVSGVWEKLGPGEAAAIVLNGRRWSGLTWGDIGEDGVLRYETPKRDRYVEIDLALYPLVAAALADVAPESRVGPLILDERTGLPYSEGGYGKRWREIADAAGLPREVWNRDLRAGGVTEGHASGARIEDISKHAAHADPSFTARVYSRDHLEAARKVATLRIKHRGEGK